MRRSIVLPFLAAARAVLPTALGAATAHSGTTTRALVAASLGDDPANDVISAG